MNNALSPIDDTTIVWTLMLIVICTKSLVDKDKDGIYTTSAISPSDVTNTAACLELLHGTIHQGLRKSLREHSQSD